MPGKKRTATGVLGGLLGIAGLSAVAGLLIAATVTPALAVAGTATSNSIDLFENLPSDLEIDPLMQPSRFFYNNPDNGQPVQMTSFYEQNRSPVRFDQIAPVMIDAILSSEDNRYFTHGGIDVVGTTRAILSNRSSGGVSGGSSISQQYVKNIAVQDCEADAKTDEERIKCYNEATNSDGTKGYERKLKEMRYAIALEQKYDKETILVGYLNIANFGGQTYGIDAAAKRYFNVNASQLNLDQASTLAGMVQDPNSLRFDDPSSETNGAANGYAKTKERQVSVLYNMHQNKKITDDEYKAALDAPIQPVITTTPTGCSAAVGMEYYCQMMKEVLLNDPKLGDTPAAREMKLMRGGLQVHASLDARLQANATAAVSSLVPATLPDFTAGSSGVNVEVGTGRVLSIAQNTHFTEGEVPAGQDPRAYSSQVFASDTQHGDNSIGFPVGSTFKVFTLLEWLNKGNSLNESLNGVNNRTFTSKCNGDTVTLTQSQRVQNFGNAPGNRGTPMSFTAASLNSGFFAMAEKLDMCSGIAEMAKKFGAVPGDGSPLNDQGWFWLLGSNSISPVAMGAAYAGIANSGNYCQPRVIDRITDASGKDVDFTQPTCTQVVQPDVAHAAMVALKGVMFGGTGAAGNPYNGDVGGKTGTHESLQTWLIETSSKVTSVAWVGQYEGNNNIYAQSGVDGRAYDQIRYELGRRLQETANDLYGAPPFEQPTSNLTRVVLRDLPNVVGKSVEEATTTLQQAGFTVAVGGEVDGAQPKGQVAAQDPGAGQAAAGTTVTISPSNGDGITVPDVTNKSVEEAKNQLKAAGFGNVAEACTAKKDAPKGGKVTGVSPAAGSAAKRGAEASISFERESCR